MNINAKLKEKEYHAKWHQEKKLDEGYRKRRGIAQKRYAQTHRDERSAYNKQYQKEHPSRNPEQEWKRHLKRQYNMTVEEWDVFYAQQKGLCANPGCARELEGKGHVDHCHSTGQVRGILCQACNRALGLLYDDRARILGLAEYLMQDDKGEANEAS